MRQLSGSDAFFLYADRPGRHQHISTLYIYDPAPAPNSRVSFRDIYTHIETRLDVSRIFRERLVNVPFNLDYPYWVEDPGFELDFHLRHIALPQPGDWRHLCIQVARLHSRPLDMTRPPWEMYVIEGLDSVESLPAGAFAVMTKVHHAAVDDATEEDFTIALHDLERHADALRPKTRWHPEEKPGTAELLMLAWFNNTTKLLETGQTLLDRLPLIGRNRFAAGELAHAEHGPAPVTRFDHRISPRRVWDARFFDLAEIARIAGTVRDADTDAVALAICGAAARNYLAAKGQLPIEPLWALLPVHRQVAEKAGLPGHRVQLGHICLATDRDDPRERLAAIVADVRRAREDDALDAGEMNELQDSLPATTMNLAARAIAANLGPGRRYRKNHNMIVSITPGPDRPLFMCGAKLIAYTGMGAIMDDLALAHTVTTYDGRLAIAFVTDRRIMPDPAAYADYLEEAFAELRSTAGARRKAG